MFERALYFEKIRPFIDKPVIKLITGMRRCGKSSFFKLLIEYLRGQGNKDSHIIYISMELMEFSFIKDHRILYDHIVKKLPKGKKKKYLFIDEVQEIPGWEKAVNSILAEGLADIYLTGSNCRLFSSEFATLLTGRYVELPMLPLSFAEFLTFRQFKGGDLDNEFAKYIKYGGLPGIHHFELEDEVVYQYVDSIFSTILLKDVVARHNIRDVFLLKKIASFLFDNCGNLTSAKRIADFLKAEKIKTTLDTVQNYISYLCDAFLFYTCKRYDIKGKRHLELSEKFYSADPGIRHSILGYREADIAGILENLVYLELLRRGYAVNTGKFNSLEVDFVAQKNDELLYVQVAYLLQSDTTENREFGVLEKIADNFPKIVLTMDKFFSKGRNGIKRVYLPDFFLEKN